MSQVILTSSIENATVTFGSAYGGSSASLLKDRSLRTLGFNSGDGTGTQYVELDWGSGNTVAMANLVLCGLATSDDVGINVYVWNGSSFLLHDTTAVATYTGGNTNIALTSADTQKVKIEFTRAASSTLQLASIFIGTAFTFPTNYKYNNTRAKFMRGEKEQDFHGYPVSSLVSGSNSKERWNVTFQMDSTNLELLYTAVDHCWIDKKPFVFLDQNLDNNYRFCHLTQPEVKGENIAADYYEVTWTCDEI